MDIKNLITVSVIFMIFLTAVTVVVINFKPQMHKSVVFEQIIYKRSK
ncbi:hypothetical protein J6P92_05640 [bacterium]|nr:hypothetical protein [bacterium]